MAAVVDKTCAGRTRGHYYDSGCRSKGSLFEDGKWWCKIHAPSIKVEKRRARDAKWEAEWAERARLKTEREARKHNCPTCGVECYGP